jgi:uncharacterized protein (TIGR02453 family)
MQEILRFLSQLKQNNNREWFNENKATYQHVKEEYEKLVAKIIGDISQFDSDIGLLRPPECVFRIYRDVRFSKNKDPYKTHLGSYYSKGGRKGKYGGYYVHIEPGASFAGGGIWHPEREVLKAIRYEIYNDPQAFVDLLEAPDIKKHFDGLMDDKLQRPPKDFPADFEYIDLLKYKSFTLSKSLSDESIASGDFYPELLAAFGAMKPLVGFLNHAVDQI